MLFNKTIGIIEDWVPGKEYSNEHRFRNDLMKFLRKNLNTDSPIGFSQQHVKIKKESGRALADISIDDKIGIELKRNLKGKSRVDRLVGQLRRYKKDYEDIIIVLVGKKTSNEALDELKEAVREARNQNVGFNPQRIEIIDKSHPSKKSKGFFGI